VVPVEREAVQRDGIDLVEDALPLHVVDELRIDGRDAAQHARETAALGADGLARALDHVAEARPVGIDLEVPVRLVVGLVPEHDGFDHGSLGASRRVGGLCLCRDGCVPADEDLGLGVRQRREPALRSMASRQARFGIHQFVGSFA
jgi:hypothetical protein